MSPFDEDRDVVAACIRDWNSIHRQDAVRCEDLRWELDAVPEINPAGAQAALNKQLVDSADILIAVFKARLGSPTRAAQSGTVEEIERFAASRRPVMLYFFIGDIPRNHDPEQLKLLKAFEREISSTSIYKQFTNVHDLRGCH